MKKIALINGPNLNLLGLRETNHYGTETLEALNLRLSALGDTLGLSLEFMQSNHEGDLIDYIQGLRGRCAAIIINAGAYTHTSIGLRDALAAVALPFIEVHISNVAKRESFRHHSYLSDLASGVIEGFGTLGYSLALYAVKEWVGLEVGEHFPSP